MSLGAVHRWATFATVTLPVLGLLSGSSILLVNGLLLVALVAVGVATLHQPERSRTRKLVVHGGTVIGLGAALAIFPDNRIDAGLSIVMLGMFNRCLLRAGQRDDLILVGAAGVLLAASTIITPGFAFALIVVAFVPSALWLMLCAGILGLSERAEPGLRPATFRRLAARPAPRLGRTMTGWGLGLMLVGYVAVSFLPRFQFGHLLSPGGFLTFSGASTRMSLTTGGVRGASSGAVALRIDARPGEDAAELEGLYARVFVLDRLDAGGFVDGGGEAHPTGRLVPEAKERCRSVRFDRIVARRELHPVAAIGRTGPSKVLVGGSALVLDSGTWVTRVRRSKVDVQYRVCLDEPASTPLTRGEADGEAARWRALPDDLDPRIPELAQRLVAGADTPEAMLARLLDHFGRRFRYTLEPIEGTEPDPLVRFLFEARAGHCELYAGALAVLARSVGIPARVASGFYGGWFNHRSRQLELGDEDAHAWVEVFVDGAWRWVDATPPASRARRTHKRFAFVRDLWDALESWWFTYVIDFDESRRQALVRSLSASMTDLGSADGWGEGPSGLGSGPGRPGASPAIVGGSLLLLALGAGALVLRARPRIGPLGARLRNALGGEPHRPLLALARAQAPAPVREAAVEAVTVYERIRYGPPRDRPPPRAAIDAVRRLERVAREHRPARGRRGRPQSPSSSG